MGWPRGRRLGAGRLASAEGARPGTPQGAPGHPQEGGNTTCRAGPVAAGTAGRAAEGPAAHAGAAARGRGRPPCRDSPLSWAHSVDAPREGRGQPCSRPSLRTSAGQRAWQTVRGPGADRRNQRASSVGRRTGGLTRISCDPGVPQLTLLRQDTLPRAFLCSSWGSGYRAPMGVRACHPQPTLPGAAASDSQPARACALCRCPGWARTARELKGAQTQTRHGSQRVNQNQPSILCLEKSKAGSLLFQPLLGPWFKLLLVLKASTAMNLQETAQTVELPRPPSQNEGKNDAKSQGRSQETRAQAGMRAERSVDSGPPPMDGGAGGDRAAVSFFPGVCGLSLTGRTRSVFMLNQY